MHLLTLDEDCLEGGVTADGDRCRRWPTGRPATAFYRDRASGTERVRAANTYPTFISNRFAAKHMARSIKKKLRRKAFTASGNEYEELLHLATVKLNRVTLYPYNLLHAPFLDPSTVGLLSKNPALGRLSVNMFFYGKDARAAIHGQTCPLKSALNSHPVAPSGSLARAIALPSLHCRTARVSRRGFERARDAVPV